LISGESGTGKELVAKSIHSNSKRADKPIITINCGAMPENLLESELFGHKKGAFSGAIFDKQGLFELADEGSIFLDEIGEMPLHLQVKILRVIQEKEYRRVGDIKDIKTDVRIIAATNKNLEEESREGRFREDLYYRLNVIEIKLPPLRDRREDIPSLVNHFLAKYNDELDRDIKKVSSKVMDLLCGYRFPGNIRELENIVERAVALEKSDIILPESLPESVMRRDERSPASAMDISPDGVDMEKIMDDMEKGMLLKALEMAGGVKKRAANLLNVSFRSFRYRLAKHGLENEDRN
jgi:two-component system response regulator PilR (NtrC family)